MQCALKLKYMYVIILQRLLFTDLDIEVYLFLRRFIVYTFSFKLVIKISYL